MSVTIDFPGVVNVLNKHLDDMVTAIPSASRPKLFLLGSPLADADQYVRVLRIRYNQQRRTTLEDVHKADLLVEVAVAIAQDDAQASYLKMPELIARMMLELECKHLTLADHNLSIVSVSSADIAAADEEPQSLVALLTFTMQVERWTGNTVTDL